MKTYERTHPEVLRKEMDLPLSLTKRGAKWKVTIMSIKDLNNNIMNDIEKVLPKLRLLLNKKVCPSFGSREGRV